MGNSRWARPMSSPLEELRRQGLHSTTCQFPPLAGPMRLRRLACLSWRICFSTARVLMPRISAICGIETLGDLRAMAMILSSVFPELFLYPGYLRLGPDRRWKRGI